MTMPSQASAILPDPPKSTLDLQRNVASLRMMLNIAYSGNADRDFAALLTVQLEELANLAQTGLAHSTDPELRALVQAVAVSADADNKSVLAWKQRQRKA